QSLLMRRIENQLLPVVAAAMTGDLPRAIEDANLCPGCGQRQLAAHGLRRDRVVVSVEAHVDGLGRAYRDYTVGVELVERQLEQARPLLLEDLRHSSAVVVRPLPLMCHLVAPLQRLEIARFQSGERAGRPERIAYIAYRAFDASLLVAGPYLAGTRLEVIMSSQLQKTGIEVDLAAMTFNNG